jgi:O-antigen/teichoic acid export membrane protein
VDASGASATRRGTDVLSDEFVGPRVVKGGAQRTIGFLISNLLTAAGAVVLLRYLGVVEFGRFGTVMALLALVQGVTDAGLGITASRELSVLSDEAERREMLGHILGIRIALTSLGIAFAVVFAVVAGYGDELVAGTAVAGIGVLVLSLQAAMLLPLIVGMENGRIAVSEILRQALLVGLFVVLVIVGAGLMGFFAAQLVAALCLMAVTPLLLGRERFVAPRWSIRRMRPLLVVGIPVAVSTVLGMLYFRLLVVLMSVVSDDATEIGYFVTSTRIVEIAVGLPVLLVTVVLPVLSVAAREDRERVGYVTARMTETMAIGGIAIALFICIGARPLILVLGGEEYEAAAPVLSIQAIALVTIFIAAAWTPTLVSTGHVRNLALATAAGVAALVVIGLVLIPEDEARGAALTAVLADLILCAAMFVAVWRAGPGRRVEAGRLARILVAGAVGAAVALLPLPDAALAPLAVAAFLVAARALGAIPQELLDGVHAVRARLRDRGATSG